MPAAGWIKELIAKPDGIWSRVEWTDRARQLITAREYRYLSPALLLAKGSNAVMRIKGAGLVHNPALELTALAREEESATPALARIAEALGLDADADEVAILSATHDTTAPDPARFMPADKVAELMADLRETKTQLRELQTNIRVDAAIAGGQMPPAMRDWTTALCMADPDAFETFAAESEKKHACLFRRYDFSEERLKRL
ncbi:MAG: phage protease, partial [Tropicimonas sp.]|uniref:phage protease n=1 Tax=Tropicimonas sp. TaxID=2067044 RepID=UPI003A8812CC